MYKLSDVTFIIPFRQDSIDRLENIFIVIKFLKSNFITNISVLESSSYNNGLLELLLGKEIQYEFIEDADPVFYRTKYINHMVRKAETPYVAVWDTDVIVPTQQVEKSIEILRNGDAHFVYPYEKEFLDVTPIIRKLFILGNNILVLEDHKKKMTLMYPPNPVGGGFFTSLDAYKEVGLENENFYGWGPEDGERFYRWKNLGYKVERVPGPMFHLNHQRALNSFIHNRSQMFIKNREILKVRRNSNTNTSLGENDIITF